MILLTFNILNNSGIFQNGRVLSDTELLEITHRNTFSILRTLENHDVKSTFFIDISIAEKSTELLKKIVSKGHEVAFYNRNSSLKEIENAKKHVEAILEKPVRGIRQKDVTISVNELKLLEFTYISNIENSNILFPFKRLQRSTDIVEDQGLSIVPESISPYSQLPYNDFVFQAVPMKYYQGMVTETLQNDEFVLIYLNTFQFTEGQDFKIKMPFYRKYNLGKKMEDKLEDFLAWINENELATARMKDYIL